MKKGVDGSFAKAYRVLFSIKPPGFCRWYFLLFLALLFYRPAVGQTCTVINSVPAIPPKSGTLDRLYSAQDSSNYAVAGTLIYDTYDINGKGSPDTVINSFWNNLPGTKFGPLERTGVWAASNPLTLGFSACVTAPVAKDYYVGLAADNSGTLLLDGNIIVQGMDFMYWRIFRVPLTKGTHFLEFKVINFEAEAALGFEIYNNTKQEILNAQSYADLDLVFSTRTMLDIGATVEEGDPATSYSCPVGFIQDYCAGGVPVCSQFVPINLVINNPPAACSSASVDITSPLVTAGSPSSLVYTYWKDSAATIPLDNPDQVTQSGTYYIMGNSNGCYLIKPVTVVVNSVSTSIAKTICPGDNYLGYNKTGTYVDTLQAADGCDSLVTVNLTVLPSVNLGKDRVLCLGDSIVLSPGSYSSYLWQDNTTAPQYVVTAPGTYSVRVMDENGCSSSDTVIVKGINCSLSNIPNTFTPNGDGINDTWQINALRAYPQCSVLIYNRWGQSVFSSIGYATPWDGTSNHKNLPVGTYYYIIDLKNNVPPVSGFVTIIR